VDDLREEDEANSREEECPTEQVVLKARDMPWKKNERKRARNLFC